MSRQSIVLVVTYLLVTLAGVMALFVWWQRPFFLGLLLVIALWAVLALALILKAGTVVVGEMDVAVVFERHTDNFAYFIDAKPSGSVTGRPFHKHQQTRLQRFLFRRPYYYFINPFEEHVKDWISKRPQTVKGRTESVRTQEGIPLTISWAIGYTIDPLRINPGIEYKLARGLPQFSNNIVSGRVIHSLRHIIEQKTVAELYQKGAIQNLENELRAEVNKRAIGVGINEISATDTKIGPIEVPAQVEKALEAAHERELNTKTAVKALEELRQVVSSFQPSDMERLAELERLRILDEHGGSLIYSMSSLMKSVNGKKEKQVHHK